MEVSQEELLEQSKISALEAALYKNRAIRAANMYEALYAKVKEVDETAEDQDLAKMLDFYRTFPEKLEV